MRLLNIKTLKLESFHNAEVAPSYAILSHRWEDEEVLFEDVDEKPGVQELRNLQRKLEETERRLDTLYRRFEAGTQTSTQSDTISEPSGSATVASNADSSEPSAQVHESQATKPKGWAKVLGCCKVADQCGISHVWIDTCCIDKSSSSELSESLNSMFAWYRSATLCIAYLSDVTQDWGEDSSVGKHPRKSVWFGRGWTLQELIASSDIWFYKGDWTFLGIRSELVDELHEITGIRKEILRRNGLESLHSTSIAARMSWAADRQTTRPEDRAYSLLGIFGVNMPILYGEGEHNAFFRLQVMVFQMISDHSIFTWRVLSLQWNERERFFGSKFQGIGLLAPSVICFKGLGDVEQIRYENVGLRGNFEQEFKPTSPHSMCVQLIMRHLPPNHKYFHEHESRFEALLGYLNSKEGKRHAFTIILVRTGLGQYRRLVQRRPIQDLQVIDLDDFLASAASLSVTDVLIFNPRPILPPKSYASRQYVPIALNCATAIKTGVEIGGCWGEEPDDVKAEEISGEKNYIAVLWRSDESRGPWRNSIAFTVRNMKSGKICGLILVVKDWETIDVSIVYDLAERDFKERDFFDSLLERHSKLKSQNLVDDVISYKLSDGSHLFLSCENQEILCGQGPREIAQTRLEDLNIENLTYQEVRDILCQGAKAQLRVGIIR